ncbi:MAG: hypothetical protein C0598_12180 [Marinilabiliales bacterium]|nr:MAG: hypothetical protein C0598_12180 [Marinilabiliales bacterium]
MSQVDKDFLKNEIQKLKHICNQYDEGNESIDYDKKYSEIIENVYNANLDRDEDLTEDLAYINFTLGNMAYSDGNYEMSLEHYNASSNFYYKLDDKENLVISAQGIVDSYYMLKQYSKVMEYNPIVMNYYKEKGEKSNEASAAYYSAESCLRLDKFKESASYANKALELYKSLNEEDNQAYSYHQLGRINFCTNNLDEAIDNYKKAIELRKNLGLIEFLPVDYNDLGDAYYYKDENKKAKKAYLKALDFNSRNYDNEKQKTIYKNLAKVCYYLDEEEEGIEYAYNAIELYNSENDKYELIDIYTTIGKNYFSLENYSAALKAYSEAENLCAKYDETQDVFINRANLNVDIYKCCYNMQEYKTGIQFLKTAIDLNRVSLRLVEMAENYYEIAFTYFRGLNDIERARINCDSALDLLNEFPDEAFTLKAKIYELYGDIAPKYLMHINKKFIDENKRYHATETTEALKTEILKETMLFYKNAIANYLKAEEYDKEEIVNKKIDLLIETMSSI